MQKPSKPSISSKPNKSGIQIYKRLLVYVKPYRVFFAISIFGFLIYSGGQFLLVNLTKEIVNSLQTNSRDGMTYLPLFFSGVFVVQGLGTYLGNYFLAKVSTSVVHAIRCEIFNKYTELPTAFFDSNNSGHLISPDNQ